MASFLDWHLWCRLCGKEDPVGNVDLLSKNEQHLVNTVRIYLGVNIRRNDGLPRTICTECYTFVTSWTNFKERVPVVQHMFKELKSSLANTKFEIQITRLKYGLLIEEHEFTLLQQPKNDVHHCETLPEHGYVQQLKTEVDHCEAVPGLCRLDESETIEANPLEQPITEFIIKEEILEEEYNADMEDYITNDLPGSYADVAGENGNEDFDMKLRMEDGQEQSLDPSPNMREHTHTKEKIAKFPKAQRKRTEAERHKTRMRVRRLREDPEYYARERASDKVRLKKRREEMTDEERARYRAAATERTRKRRLKMKEQKGAHLQPRKINVITPRPRKYKVTIPDARAKDAQRKRTFLQSLTEEERAKLRSKDAERKRLKRAEKQRQELIAKGVLITLQQVGQPETENK